MRRKAVSFVLVAAIAASLAGCGASGNAVSSVPAPASSAPVSVAPASSAPAPASSTPAISAQSVEEEPAGFTNPLTGEPTEEDISNKRPILAMLNSLKKALPQSGNGSADMLFEIPEEGGITRVMAVYQDPHDVGDIGTIRSTRQYYVFLAMGLDGLLAHAGTGIYAQETLDEEGYDTLDFMKYGGALYWRDQWRKENVGTEHSLYTSSENIENFLADHDEIRQEHEEGFVNPYTFTEDATPADGSDASEIDVEFSDYKSTEFTYDTESGSYLVSFFDEEPYMDNNTDTQVAVKNVIILPTEQSTQDDGQHQKFDLSSGTGYFACNGKYEEINWSKGDMYDPLVFTKTDGSQLDLNVGKTYICILDDDQPIAFEP